MKNKKLILSKVMHRARMFGAIKRVQRDRLVVINYHRIKPAGAFSTPFDDEVFGPNVRVLESQLRWLKDNVNLLDEHQAIEWVRGGRRPRALSALITFDDGYRDNFTEAFPVLKRLGIPAIMFIPTSIIESRKVGWWDVISYLLKQTSKRQITYDGQTHDVVTDRLETATHFHRKMKKEMMDPDQRIIEKLAEVCEVDLPGDAVQDDNLMTWAQIRALADAGISIGSHTHNHRILGLLDRAEQTEELQTSKAIIEERVGQPVRSLAYPVGGKVHFNAVTKSVAGVCGYDAAYSFYSGFNRWGDSDIMDVRRTALAYEDVSMLAGAVVLTELFSWSN